MSSRNIFIVFSNISKSDALVQTLGGGGLTCICRDMGMCHYFEYYFGGAPGFLGIFLDCSWILGYHFFGEIYLFRNHPDFWVMIWIFNKLHCRMLPAGLFFLIFLSQI